MLEVDGFEKAPQARRRDQKHGRDGKGFLGCLIFSHAKPLHLSGPAALSCVLMRLPEPLRGLIHLPQARLTASPSFPSRVHRLVWLEKKGEVPWRLPGSSLACSRCGWRPLRLIRYKPSQLMFHHPTVQTTTVPVVRFRLMLGHTQQSPGFPPLWKHDQAFLPALHTVTA